MSQVINPNRGIANSERPRIVIMGAAGRDFHNFNTHFRDNPAYDVVAFTATQIPNIETRIYPPSLSGGLYPEGIQIQPESNLYNLIREENIDQVIFSYSDVSHEYVMHRASMVLASGADFRLMGLKSTQLTSVKPIISICATRTGSGKSQTTRRVVAILKSLHYRVVVVRHPMPYGDLTKQVVQRIASYDDLSKHKCTIEEREEYEPHIENNVVVFAGVDYKEILSQAEQEADIIVWDGGNNDIPFYKSDLHVVLVDPHRPGHERSYYPGETNVLSAHVLVINKIDTSSPEAIQKVRDNLREMNPDAIIIEAASPIILENPECVMGKRVVVIEDGPTLTHGGMEYGAGWISAKRFGASEIVDPRPYAVGSIRETYTKYPITKNVLPAMGYDECQISELEQTINSIDADLVLIGTPIDLGRLMSLNKPCQRIRYELQEIGKPSLEDILASKFDNLEQVATPQEGL